MKTLFLAAALMALSAHAAEIDNPACDLITEDEAHAAMGGAARESEINREMTGASDCGWIDAEENIVALNRARGMAFQGNSTADDGYRALYRDYESGGVREDLQGFGEAAFIFTPAGAKPGAQHIFGLLRQGNVVLISTHGVSRKALLHLAELAAGRL